jgi:hypothetical protein
MAKIIQKRGHVRDTYGRVINIPTIVKCCEKELVCMGFINTCEICGTDYDWNGIEMLELQEEKCQMKKK